MFPRLALVTNTTRIGTGAGQPLSPKGLIYDY